MAVLDTITRLAQVNLPNCPAFSIRMAAIQAAIELCEKSIALRKPTTITLVEDTSEYLISGDANRRVVQIISAKKPTANLKSVNADKIREIAGSDVVTGEPTHYYQADHTVINVWRTPDADADGIIVTLNVAYSPTHDATALEEPLFTRHLDALVDGVLSIRMRDSNKPWSNPQDAMMRRSTFLTAIDLARIAADQANGDSGSTIDAVRFGFR